MAGSIEDWLKKHELGEYAPKFEAAGFNDIKALKELAAQDLEALVSTIRESTKIPDEAANKIRIALKLEPDADDGEVKGDEAGATSAEAASAEAAPATGGGEGSGAAKSQPNWKAMPDAMLGTYITTVITDPAGSDDDWKVNGLLEMQRRTELASKSSAAAASELGAAGFMETAILALKRCSSVEAAVTAALTTIRFLCRSPDNRGKINAAEMESIVWTMKSFPSLAPVQQMGAATLVNLASSAENQKTLGTNGALEATLSAIKTHRLNADVVWCSLAAMRNMTILGANQAKLAELGGIKAVANSLGAHRMNEKINMMGCGVLRNLAVHEEHRHNMVSQGGVAALALALNAHKDNEEVQVSGLGALNNLAFDESAKAELATQGVATICKTALASHPKNIDVKTQATSLLSVLDPKSVKSGGLAGRFGFGRKKK